MDWEIYALDDDRVRLFGQEIANDLGRKIIASLREFPKSPNDIARELNLPLTTVIFHIDKLLDAGVIEAVGRMAGKRGRKTLYTLASPAFLILPVTKEERGSYLKELMNRIVPPREILAKSFVIGILVAIFIIGMPWYLMGSPREMVALPTSPTTTKPFKAPEATEKRVPSIEGGHGYGGDMMTLLMLAMAATLLSALLTALWVLHREALPYSEHSP